LQFRFWDLGWRTAEADKFKDARKLENGETVKPANTNK